MDTDTLQILVLPFYQIMVSCDDAGLFRKVLGAVVKRILSLICTREEGQPQLANVDMRPFMRDLFLIAASPCVPAAPPILYCHCI